MKVMLVKYYEGNEFFIIESYRKGLKDELKLEHSYLFIKNDPNSLYSVACGREVFLPGAIIKPLTYCTDIHCEILVTSV